MQVHNYYIGKSRDAPAELSRYFVEKDLMERYHWTPQQINALSYKWIQKFYLFEKARNSAQETKQELERFKSEHTQSSGSSGRGQTRKSVITGFKNVVTSNK